MLSFKQLSEKKTKVKINPKQSEITEKEECNHTKKGMKCPTHGMKSCPDTEMSEGKKTGPCGKPAAECMCDKKEKTPAQRSIETKTNSMEETAYVSQEEVSEESTKEVAETETSLLTFGKFTEGKSLSIDDQMKISRDAAKDRNPKPDHKAIRGKMLKKPLPKDTRTDAQEMTDATGPRPGSRYRGD